MIPNIIKVGPILSCSTMLLNVNVTMDAQAQLKDVARLAAGPLILAKIN